MTRKHQINKLIRRDIPGGNELLEAVAISDRLLLLPSYDVALLSMAGTIEDLFFCSMFNHVLFTEGF